ncbi:MAG: hypothetical protein PHD76_05390 [Methylacidiphilales bacterium]|nr:hypothetical protein [Candidatus Methylacidiphilales bacterium]
MACPRLVITLGAALLAAGCSVVDSRHVDMASAPASAQADMANSMLYYLPSGRLRLRITASDKADWNIKVETLYVPDVTRAYYFSYKESALSEDEIQIAFSPEGFLNKVSSTTEDKSPAIVAKLGELATDAAKLAVMTGGAPPKTVKAATLDFVFDRVINPFDPREMREVCDILRNGAGLNLSFKTEMNSKSRTGWFDASNRGVRSSRSGGIFYRPLLPYRLAFTPSAKSDSYSLSQIVYLPDEAPLLTLEIKRAAFVKNSTTIEFENGVLKSVSYKKPSEVYGFIDIPINLAQQALSIPGELLSVRVQNINNEKKGVDANAALLQSQKEHLDAQRNLLIAQ